MSETIWRLIFAAACIWSGSNLKQVQVCSWSQSFLWLLNRNVWLWKAVVKLEIHISTVSLQYSHFSSQEQYGESSDAKHTADGLVDFADGCLRLAVANRSVEKEEQ